MSITIKLSHVFHEFTNNQETIEVDGHTVQQCLDDLICTFPSIKGALFETDNALSALVVYHGHTMLQDQLDQPVEEPDEIFILPLIYGG